MIRQIALSYLRHWWIVLAVLGSLLLSILLRESRMSLLVLVPMVAIVVGLNLREQLDHSTAPIIPRYRSLHVQFAFLVCLLFFAVVPLAFIYRTSGINGWVRLMPGSLLLGTLSLYMSYYLGTLALAIVPWLVIWIALRLEVFFAKVSNTHSDLTIQGLTATTAILLLAYLYYQARMSTGTIWKLGDSNPTFLLGDKLGAIRDRFLSKHDAGYEIPRSSFHKLKLDSAWSLAFRMIVTIYATPGFLVLFLVIVTVRVLWLGWMPSEWLGLAGALGFAMSYRDLGYELARSVSRKTLVRAIVLGLLGSSLLVDLFLLGTILLAAFINPEVMTHFDFTKARYDIAVSCGLSPVLGLVMARSTTRWTIDWSRILALYLGCGLLLAFSALIGRFLPWWSDYYGLAFIAAACVLSAYRTLLHADFT